CHQPSARAPTAATPSWPASWSTTAAGRRGRASGSRPSSRRAAGRGASRTRCATRSPRTGAPAAGSSSCTATRGPPPRTTCRG
ncbi:MAG: hypothetical protein AVDCRST_MAG11-31, partial [uncultured Gemmatimonadaceae bacterium]